MGNSAALAQKFKEMVSFIEIDGWERFSDELIEDLNGVYGE